MYSPATMVAVPLVPKSPAMMPDKVPKNIQRVIFVFVRGPDDLVSPAEFLSLFLLVRIIGMVSARA